MLDYQAITTAALAIGSGIGALAYGLQKYQVSNSKKDTIVANQEAQTAQYKILQDAIKSNKEELIELRAAFLLMDRTIHRQQRTMTRMEMLLRQFSSLVSSKGIQVPAYMQVELEELIQSDSERNQE